MSDNKKDFLIILLLILIGLGLWAWIAWAYYFSIPEAEGKEVRFSSLFLEGTRSPTIKMEIVKVEISAYTAREEECDSTPDITASGKKAKGNIAANNCLPFGTAIDYEGITYRIEDRMNKKYPCDHIDLLFADLKEAKEFGRRINQEITIYF